MALYAFSCPSGHSFERVVPLGTEATECLCGGPGERVFIPMPFAHTHGYPTDHEPPRQFHEAHEEAMHWKGEAMKAKEEAIGNGWSPKE